jgi:outer membrane biosynthesis protein TonB
MRRGQRPLLALAAGLVIVGCGSDDEGKPIPQASVADIETQLDNIQGQIEEGSLGACEDIKKRGNTFAALESAVDRVPDSVDADVRDALAESVDRLGELVDEECSSREPDQTETTPEPTETITVEEPPPETETTPPPETETVPPEEEAPSSKEKEKKEKEPKENEGLGGESGGLPVPEGDGG